ncbi:MAG: hypothetical protein IRY99_27890, partial [Isosphaeraceae bacterium]|nr:hypothetical protein [Isosphaeraceae bacterium]
MSIALGLLAMVLVGADKPPATPPAEALSYRVRVLEMNGLDWRRDHYFGLRPAARQGAAAAWTASKEKAEALEQAAHRVLTAPQVLAAPGARAMFEHGAVRHYVAGLVRDVDGPEGRPVAVAYRPEVDQVRGTFRCVLSGRQAERGFLIRVAIDDTRLVGVHTVNVADEITDQDGKKQTMHPQLQVPEVVNSRAEGEWVVPAEETILVVSLGAHAIAEEAGQKAGLQERLVLIEPRLVAVPASGPIFPPIAQGRRVAPVMACPV